jgi:hypothetical protein
MPVEGGRGWPMHGTACQLHVAVNVQVQHVVPSW